jgi:predicted protein tyrosine phosphatase
MTIPEIVIASWKEAGELLHSTTNGPTFRYLVSIGEPYSKYPPGYGKHDIPKLRLEFEDVEPPETIDLATIEQITGLVRFLATVDGKTLIHCQAGISRSSAAACILASMKAGVGNEVEAFQYIKSVRERADPNRHVLRLGDEVLGLNGRLLVAADAVF